MARYYVEAEKTTDELERMFIDEISMQKDIRIISLMQTLEHKALDIVKRGATADAQEVRYGKWEEVEGNHIFLKYKCSVCGMRAFRNDYLYCHCGAKMNGKEEKNESKNPTETE